MEIMSLNNIIK